MHVQVHTKMAAEEKLTWIQRYIMQHSQEPISKHIHAVHALLKWLIMYNHFHKRHWAKSKLFMKDLKRLLKCPSLGGKLFAFEKRNICVYQQ